MNEQEYMLVCRQSLSSEKAAEMQWDYLNIFRDSQIGLVRNGNKIQLNLSGEHYFDKDTVDEIAGKYDCQVME